MTKKFSIEKMYKDDLYLEKVPLLHQADVEWKISKIIPLIDRYYETQSKKNINILDVGGGNGLILKMVSEYIANNYQTNVNKYLLDLSPGILEIQKKNNPDFKIALNEDISNTSFSCKQMDLTLMIDVLEHVEDPKKALIELKKISKYVIFKVPLQNNLQVNLPNFLSQGKFKQQLAEDVGHVNFYDLNSLKKQIKKYNGKIKYYYFTNSAPYLAHSKKTPSTIFKYCISQPIYKLSPEIMSLFFTDFLMILTKCY